MLFDTLHGITSQFMPRDSNLQFGLDIRYVLEENKVVYFGYNDNVFWSGPPPVRDDISPPVVPPFPH